MTNRIVIARGQSKEAAAIVNRLVNVCWYFFKLAVGLALVVVAAVGVYMYVRMDDEIRRHVESILAEHYPHLEATVGGARLVEGQGIFVYDIELAPLGDRRVRDELLVVDEMLVVCNVELTAIVKGMPPIQRIEIKHPRVTIRRKSDGRWNFDALIPRHPDGMPIPQIVIRRGEGTLVDEVVADAQPILIRDVEMSIAPTAQSASLGAWPSLKIEGTASGPQFKQAQFQAVVDGPRQACSGVMTLKSVQLNEQLIAWARPALPSMLAVTRFSGVVDGTINASWQPGVSQPPTGSATLTLREGKIEDPRLARPVVEITGGVTVDPQQLKVEDLRGKWGATSIALAVNRQGWVPNAKIALAGRLDNVTLDEELHRTLAILGDPQVGFGVGIAKELREEFEKYRPQGVVDGTLQATFDGQRWLPTATLTGRELSFESDEFAYRLYDGAGVISFQVSAEKQKPVLDVNLYGLAGGQRVNIVAQVIDPRPEAAGWAEITGENLEIDDRLIAAVDQRIEEECDGAVRSMVASLHPAGKFNLVFWRIERPTAGAEPLTSMRLDVTDVRVNYDGFPYPLQKVSGVITAEEDHWTFSNFVSGGRRIVAGHGHLKPTEPGGPHELWLHFVGQNLLLDDGLFWAVPEPVREAWKKLQPNANGSINATADVRHRLGRGEAPSFAIVVEPQANTAFRPQFFPYFMEDVKGRITYFDGAVTIENMTARHQDGVTVGAKGRGSFTGDRGWEFTLTGLWADGLKVRPALMTALPEKLRRLIDSLRPSGTFSLHNSQIAFRQPPSAIAPLETEWDLQLVCHQTDLHCGIDVENVSGSVRLEGRSNQQQSFSSGELDLENVTYQGIQLTNVKGPMWVDESQCRFGKWATEQMRQPERRITGKMYGGTMASNAWVRFAHLPQYGAEADIVGADLTRLMVERFGGRKSFTGKIDGNVIIGGEGPSLARLTGEGKLHIREANIYELPLLVSLLKILSKGAPDSTAFNESNIEFRIQGPHITLNRIDFLGDVVDLYGYGETGFDQHVKLLFRAELGPRKYAFPLVKTFVGQASGNFMQMYVDGTLANPQVSTEAFPGFTQMIENIRTDFEQTGGPSARAATRTDAFGRPLGK